MPPSLALILWLVLLGALLRFDPARVPKISLSLWVPVTWMFIVGSRLPSQWLSLLGGAPAGYGAQAMQEGNSVDSTTYCVLILLAIGILIFRSFKWSSFFSRNIALVAFLSFALLSVFWSDFPFIVIKRWFRDLGNYVVILVVLSDPRPLEAVRTLLRRSCYLLISLSVLLVRYYVQIAIIYSPWTGAPEYIGAATSKNMLGVLCLISGIFFFWDTVTRWPERKERRTKQIILVNFAFLAMTLWLLNLSSSATSRVCLVFACFVIAAARSKTVKRRPALLTVPIPIGICLYLVLAFGFGIDINALVAQAVGRDPTLTGRTVIWNAVLSTHTNPIIGCGYESFWLGHRLQEVWALTGEGITEAHNGYLEIYLNLGMVGLFLLVGFLISSYLSMCRRFETFSSLGSLSLALWAVLPFYNVTEAAFKGHFIFITFLLGAIVVPRAPSVRGVSSADKSSFGKSSSELREAVSR
jgi:exopolysaccharide production protein ExoQ